MSDSTLSNLASRLTEDRAEDPAKRGQCMNKPQNEGSGWQQLTIEGICFSSPGGWSYSRVEKVIVFVC